MKRPPIKSRTAAVQRGLRAMAEALRLVMDYFSLERDVFISRWLPDREKDLARQITGKHGEPGRSRPSPCWKMFLAARRLY